MTGKSVNVPVDEKIKERDINNKLQLYGIYSAFANGKAPSNKQIDVALNSFLESKALAKPSGKLSEEGRKLVGDFRDVVEAAKQLLLSKNEGNLLQDFIWQTQQITGASATTPNAPVSADQAKRHGNEALDGLRTLGTLLISNGQFRKLLSDAQILLRDIVGDAATKTAGKVNPNDDQLKQIDEPAQDDTWHDVPDLSKDNLRNQMKSRWDEQKPFSKGDVQEAAGNASQAANPTGSRDPADTANLAAREQQQGTNHGVDAQGGLQAGINTLNEKADRNIPEESKDVARSYKNRTSDYLKGKMPKERREQTIWRLKKMVVEIQGHRDYQRAIETLLSLAEQYAGHGRDLADQSTGAVKGAHEDDSLKTAEADLRTLLERFANSTSFDDLFDSFDQIYSDADRDPELKNWFKAVNAYIHKCLQEQGFILQEQADREYDELYDRGQYLLRDKYRGHTDRILDEFKFIGNQFDQDPLNNRLSTAMTTLFMDLGNDEEGNTTFKPHLVKDLTEVILPAVFTNIRYVPIPRIEYSDPMVDLVVENLVIESDNLTPNVLEFSTDNYWRWGRKKIESKNKNKVMLAISGVQLDLRDVAFYVKRKQGFPSITDKGVADIFLGGTGLSFKIKGETADKKDRHHFFKVDKVDVDIKNVNIKLKKSNHKFLFALVKPVILKALRPALQKVIEKQIKDYAAQLDGLAWDVHQEAERAKADLKRNPDPENAQNLYSRYARAAKDRVARGQKKAEEVASDKKANVAITQHDSIFPDLKLPGGISTKATEYKDLAGKGDKWESPIFSIGSAKESTNIPKTKEIKRKAHQTATPKPITGTSNSYDPVGTQPIGTAVVGGTSGVNATYPGGPLSNGAANLGAQMDGAFNGAAGGPAGLNGAGGFAGAPGYANGHGTGINAGSNGNAAAAGLNGNAKPAHQTTLYDQNPVLTGQV